MICLSLSLGWLHYTRRMTVGNGCQGQGIRSRVDQVRNKDRFSSSSDRTRTFERPTLPERQGDVLEGETFTVKGVVLIDL